MKSILVVIGIVGVTACAVVVALGSFQALTHQDLHDARAATLSTELVVTIPTPTTPVRYSLIPPLPPDNRSTDWHDGYVQGQLDYAEAFRRATVAMHEKVKP